MLHSQFDKKKNSKTSCMLAKPEKAKTQPVSYRSGTLSGYSEDVYQSEMLTGFQEPLRTLQFV